MGLENIDIKPVYLKDLFSFAQGFAKADGSGRIAPMTLQRARAQMKNPYARDNDIVLFVAYKKKQCIGYLGQIPGLLVTECEKHRVFWGSTFYMADQYRGMGIGTRLLNQLRLVPQDFVVTRITAPAYSSLIKYGMKVLGELNYLQLRVEKTHLLGRFFEGLKNYSRPSTARQQSGTNIEKIEKHLCKLEKLIFYRFCSRFADHRAADYKFQRVPGVTASDFFENPILYSPLFYRGPAVINWMLQHKWVYSEQKKTADMPRYHFSGFRQFFSYIPLKLYFKNFRQYKGFVILCISISKRKRVLKILDHSLENNNVIPAVCAVTLLYAERYQVDRVEFPERMGQYLEQKTLYKRFLKEQTREYLFFPKNQNSPLERLKGEIQFDYCDGDIAFT
jgi:GNAT superfamily N-acetyltransferase